jgi:hypothetical protein
MQFSLEARIGKSADVLEEFINKYRYSAIFKERNERTEFFQKMKKLCREYDVFSP